MAGYGLLYSGDDTHYRLEVGIPLQEYLSFVLFGSDELVSCAFFLFSFLSSVCLSIDGY